MRFSLFFPVFFAFLASVSDAIVVALPCTGSSGSASFRAKQDAKTVSEFADALSVPVARARSRFGADKSGRDSTAAARFRVFFSARSAQLGPITNRPTRVGAVEVRSARAG